MKTTSLVGELDYLFWIITQNTKPLYPILRNAVDFGFPLLNNARCAQLFVEAMARKIPQGSLRPYSEGRIPSEVKSWSEFVGSKV